ncbi:hypothetical protein M0R36_11110 [bacterium]|jgi:hypothetical protein|nr:hypothetical protein [bacterium]
MNIRYNIQRYLFTLIGDTTFHFSITKEKGFRFVFGINPPTFSFSGDELYNCVELLMNDFFQPGDVFLRKYDSYLDARFIPGELNHAGLYVGKDDGKHQVIHALSEGVIKENAINFFRTDHFVVFRPNLSIEDRMMAAKKAYEYLGTPYDFDFKFTDDSRLACTELIGACYQQSKNKFKFEMKKRFGRITLVADDIFLSNGDILFHTKSMESFKIWKERMGE